MTKEEKELKQDALDGLRTLQTITSILASGGSIHSTDMRSSRVQCNELAVIIDKCKMVDFFFKKEG